MGELTREQKQDYAKMLYLTEKGMRQKEIAEKVGVTEATVCRWVKTLGWESMRTSLMTTKDEQLSMLYAQLAAQNDAIAARNEGERFATAKEADAILKITAAIGRIESETNIGEKMSVCRELLVYARAATSFELSKQIGAVVDGYIKSKIK